MERYALVHDADGGYSRLDPDPNGAWVNVAHAEELRQDVRNLEARLEGASTENAELRAKVAELTKALADEGREVKP